LFTDKNDIHSAHTENPTELPTVCNCSNQAELCDTFVGKSQ